MSEVDQVSNTPETVEPQTKTTEIKIGFTLFNGIKPKAKGSSETTWGELLQGFERLSKATEKLQCAGWSPCLYKDNYRNESNCLGVYAFVIDVDNKVTQVVDGKKVEVKLADDELVTFERVLEALPGREVYIYTSWNHDADWPRFRAVVPFDRMVSVDEYKKLWKVCRDALMRHAITIDGQTKDPSRLWFFPADRPGYEHRHQDGEPLEVEALLAEAEADAPPAVLPPVNRVYTGSNKLDRARTYLSKCPPAIEGSGGSVTAFGVCRCVVRGFDLTEEEALDVLDDWNNRCEPPWSKKELQHKIKDARERGTSPEIGEFLTRDMRRPIVTRSAVVSELRDSGIVVDDDATLGTVLDAVSARIPEGAEGDALKPHLQVIGDLLGEGDDVDLAAIVKAVHERTGKNTKKKLIEDELKRHRKQARESKKAEATESTEHPFRVENGSIYMGKIQIANFTATVDAEIIRDDGVDRTRVLRISGTRANGTPFPQVDVDAKDFLSMGWLINEWGSAASFKARHAGHVAEAIQKLSNVTEDVVSTTYTHLGWRTADGERAFLLPGGAITKDGFRRLDVDVPDKLKKYKLGMPSTEKHPNPDATDDEILPEAWRSLFAKKMDLLDGWLASLDVLNTAPREVTVPAWLTVYMAPLIDVLGPTFVLWLHGPTGSAKSTFASLLQLHYGDFDFHTLPETWFSTSNAIETTLWRAKDVLLTIDNLVPAQTAKENVSQIEKAVRIIQSYGDGTSRSRLDAEANEKTPRPPRCQPVCTAEILPPENDSTLARVFVVQVHDYDLGKHDELKPKAALLQKSMASWIQFLAGVEPKKIKELHDTNRSEIKKWFPFLDQPNAHARLAETMALFFTTMFVLAEWRRVVTGAKLDFYEFVEPLTQAALKQPCFAPSRTNVEELGEGTQRTAPAVHDFLSCIRSLLASGEYDLAAGATGPFTRPATKAPEEVWVPKLGWRVCDEVWLYPEIAVDAVKAHNGGFRWGKRDLQGQIRPFVTETDGRNTAVKRSTSVGRQRVWILPVEVVLGEQIPEGVPDIDDV